MMSNDKLSRRGFLAATAAAPLATALAANNSVPVGLELYSVRDALQKDPVGTVRAVGKMGYDGVEFFAPYFSWTPAQAQDMRKVLDDLGIRCFSTHNGAESFAPANLNKVVELNGIIGSKYVVLAHPGRVQTIDDYKKVAEMLTKGGEAFAPHGLKAGYHNHQLEWKAINGTRPIEVLAANTSKDVMLQLDVGTCIESGSDPVAWINQNPGRIHSIHCKDYSPEAGKGYKVLFGEGVSPWKKIFAAAEDRGGVEYYLIEQEGYSLPELETAQKCLAAFRNLRKS